MSEIATPLKGSQGVLVDNIFIPVQQINTVSNRSVLIPIPAGSSYQSYLAILSEAMPSDGNLGGKIFIIAFDTGEFDFGANKLFGNESDPDSPIASQKYYNGTIIFKGNGCAHTSLNFTSQYPVILDNYTEPSRPGVTLGFIDIRLTQTTTGYSVLIFNRTGGATIFCRTLLELFSSTQNDHYAIALNPNMWLGRTDLQEAAEGLFASSLSIILFSTYAIYLPEYSTSYTEYINKWINTGGNTLFSTTYRKAARVRFKGGKIPSGNYVTVKQPPFQFSVLPSISSMSGLYLDAETPENMEDGMLFRAELKQASDTADTGQPMEVVTSTYSSGQASAPVYEWYEGTVALNTNTALCLGIPLKSLTEMPETWTFTTWVVINSLNLLGNNLPLFGILFRGTEIGRPDLYIAAEQDSVGGLRFSFRDLGSVFLDSVDSDSAKQASDFPLIDTGWHHVSLRYYKDTMELYVDGKLAASVAVALDMALASGVDYYTLQIGYINEQSGQIYDSKPQYFSDARFYTRALSVYEISTLAKNRRTDPEPEPELEKGLLLRAPLSSENNIVETGQTYTETGAVTYTTDAHVPCAVFNGSSWYNVAWNAITGNSVRTIAAWIKYTGNIQNEWREATMWGAQSNNQNFGLSASDKNYLTGGVYGNDVISTVANDNEWHHLLFQYDGTAASLYIDGEQKAQKELSLNTQSSNLFIGYGGNTSSKIWTGYIADVRIYNRLLRPSEIEALADFYTPYYDPDTTRDLLFYMSMTARASTAETGQSLYYYSSSNPVEESYSGMPGLSWKTSGYNYIETSLSPIFRFSICWWQVPDSSSSDKSAWSLYNSGGYLWCLQGVSLYNGSQHLQFSEGGAPDDELHFCCIVYNGVVYTLYVDGVSHGTLSQDLRFSTTQNITLRIGNRSNTSGQYYKGWMSRFRIYSRVLSQEEVLQLYQEAW